MPRILKLAAFLLATLWLPATVHCQLEGIGIDTLFACTDASPGATHATGEECTDDGCQTIEAGQVAVTKSRVEVASLGLLACTCHFCFFAVSAPPAAPEFVASRREQTLPLQRTWQFDRRAALPSRAPDSLNVARA